MLTYHQALSLIERSRSRRPRITSGAHLVKSDCGSIDIIYRGTTLMEIYGAGYCRIFPLSLYSSQIRVERSVAILNMFGPGQFSQEGRNYVTYQSPHGWIPMTPGYAINYDGSIPSSSVPGVNNETPSRIIADLPGNPWGELVLSNIVNGCDEEVVAGGAAELPGFDAVSFFRQAAWSSQSAQSAARRHASAAQAQTARESMGLPNIVMEEEDE